MQWFSFGIGLLLSTPFVWSQQIDKQRRTTHIHLTETAGIARNKQPVEATLRFERDALKNAGDIRLVRIDGGRRTPTPFQVLDVASHAATDSFAPAAQVFVQIVFLADVPAKGAVRYEVSIGDAAPPEAAAPLRVSGAGLGKLIDSGPALFDLHAASGQLLSLTPKLITNDRLVFEQFKNVGPIPVHWNPDIWSVGARWGHTNAWNAPVAFDPTKHTADTPPTGDDKSLPFYFREWSGPLAYRLTRWGRMPHTPHALASVSYTFFAGSPAMLMQSLVEFHEPAAVHAVRNSELVFSRHQFDTAFWLGKDGKLQRAACYDYNDKDKSFGEVAKLPPDLPCLGFANERKGYGVALFVLGMTNVNKRSGHASDEQAHFYVRDYDEHGKGSSANFLYLVRPVVYRRDYLPTAVRAGSVYVENNAIVIFRLLSDSARRYDELTRWHTVLTRPLQVIVD